ncbi:MULTISPECIES: hypothetical protein [unclassified Mycolicibacterium]|uniref:hypothetical protein n=1 Tax=unclassified Mycolicibacterium TaxID=2636767 RepID=UPI002ED9D0E3
MSTTTEAATVLANAAFGDDPGRWPLPSAATPRDRWLRAVAAGGQGRYACALAELSEIERSQASGPLLSLTLSTRASFLRQLGGHNSARGADGQAWAHSGGDDATDPEAPADALIGLAADALGVGRFALSARLLERASAVVCEHRGRIGIRLAWVSAELAMMRGDGAAAVAHAERGVERTTAYPSARHAVKSDVVLAAALCSAGQPDRARVVADAALAATDKLGLVPLRWALACLLADIGSAAHSPAHVGAIRDVSADTVRRRGGVWSGD